MRATNRRSEMFYLMTHSKRPIYCYGVGHTSIIKDHSNSEREETTTWATLFRIASRVLSYAPYDPTDRIAHCYTSTDPWGPLDKEQWGSPKPMVFLVLILVSGPLHPRGPWILSTRLQCVTPVVEHLMKREKAEVSIRRYIAPWADALSLATNRTPTHVNHKKWLNK